MLTHSSRVMVTVLVPVRSFVTGHGAVTAFRVIKHPDGCQDSSGGDAVYIFLLGEEW